MATKEEIKLIEKLARAKMKLEGLIKNHSGKCLTEDPEYYGPCTCGMDEYNKRIEAALKELSLDD